VTCRSHELEVTVATLRGDQNVAVLLLGDHGIGKSVLMQAVAAELSDEVTLVSLHGSPALGNVPYGVLTPFIVHLPVEEATSQLAVLRTFWEYLEAQRSRTQKPLLLLVDDAQDLDDATAGVIAELAAAGWTKLLIGATARPGVPEPLLQLWLEGIAVRCDLRSLSREKTAEILMQKLGPQLLSHVADVLWAASGGNPLLLDCLVDDAIADGTLLQRNGVWLFTRQLSSHGDRLTDVVRRQLLRRSADEQTALNLVALVGPVSKTLVEALVDEDTVATLIDQELLRVSDAGEPELRLWHSAYGDTLRNLISPARSLQLRQGLMGVTDQEPDSAEGFLRQVSWSLECGVDVADQQLLRAAVLAGRLFEDDLARRSASQIRDQDLQMTARSVVARTHYNRSNHAAARDILESDFARGKSLTSVLAGSLLWAAVLTALGHDPGEIIRRAQALLPAGEQLARAHPAEAKHILAATRGRYRAICSMVRALAGDFEHDRGASRANAERRPPTPDDQLDAAFCLALEAERLLVMGKARQAFHTASEALATAGSGHEDFYFLAEFIVFRAAAAAIHGADWKAAEALLAAVSATPACSPITVDGEVQAAHGIILLYQGRIARSLHTLIAALESLRFADHQQLFALTASMAFVAAVESGANDQAASLLAEFEAAVPAASRYLRALSEMAVIYGRARLGAHPEAVAELRRLGSLFGDEGTLGLEFESHVLCLALGDREAAVKLLALKPEMEGQRAAAICDYAAAITTGNATDYSEAAKRCEDLELWAFAALAYDAAAHVYRSAGDTLRERLAVSQLKRCQGRAVTDHDGEEEAELDALELLTRRERDVVALATRGLSDRQIAAELQVSIRTVEGHLYRIYAKLGVPGRDQLPGNDGN